MYGTNLEKAVKLVQKAQITKRNKDLILQFKDYCASRELGVFRIVKYMQHLRGIAGILAKDFEKATKEDMERLMAQISSSNSSEWTKQSYKVALKIFYRWLYKLPKGKDPEVTEWIKTTMKNDNHKLPEDMVTEEEVLKIIGASPYMRDKALIALLWDTGIRIGELGSLKLKNVQFDDYGAILIVKGKKGWRRVRAVWSVPYIKEWMERHPNKGDPEAPLWVKIGVEGDNGAMNYYGMRKQILTAVHNAGLKKRVHAHLFRHSRATEMAKHLTEAQMKEYFGWTQSSDMASVYVHLSGRDVDQAVLKAHGIEIAEEAKDKKHPPKHCPRCYRLNPYKSKYCFNCGGPIDLDVTTEMVRRETTGAEMSKEFAQYAADKPNMLKDMATFVEFIEVFKQNPSLYEEMKAFIETSKMGKSKKKGS